QPVRGADLEHRAKAGEDRDHAGLQHPPLERSRHELLGRQRHRRRRARRIRREVRGRRAGEQGGVTANRRTPSANPPYASRQIYADFRTALSTSVLPSDQIAPGTLWLPAMTVSNAVSIQRQSSSVMVSEGNSLMVWLAWPATWVRILWSLNSGTVMSWQNRPLFAVSSTFQDAFSRSDFGGPNSTPIIKPLPRTSFISS